MYSNLLVCFFLVIFCVNQTLTPVSLDGTTGTSIYQAASYPFANGDFARGFVRLNSGFSVPAAAVVNLNLVVPAAGAIDLNGTGQITLEGDLRLDSNAQVVGGGLVDGQGYAIVLGGDLTIPAAQTLEFTSSTTLDGNGHTLTLEDGTPGGQLFINGPSNTTLTLRNIIIKGLKEFGSGDRGIKFGANPDQKLILENVTLHLADDFVFTGGKLEIKELAHIDGPYIFDYQAAYDCVINTDSTLFFDLRSTFKYNPTDNFRAHLMMLNNTSRLFLNGCTLDVPKTIGLRLKSGHLIVDHRVTFLSNGPTVEGQGIIFGCNNHAFDLAVDIMPAANIDLETAFLTYENIN